MAAVAVAAAAPGATATATATTPAKAKSTTKATHAAAATVTRTPKAAVTATAPTTPTAQPAAATPQRHQPLSAAALRHMEEARYEHTLTIMQQAIVWRRPSIRGKPTTRQVCWRNSETDGSGPVFASKRAACEALYKACNGDWHSAKVVFAPGYDAVPGSAD